MANTYDKNFPQQIDYDELKKLDKDDLHHVLIKLCSDMAHNINILKMNYKRLNIDCENPDEFDLVNSIINTIKL